MATAKVADDDVYRRMCELEQELVEFQESSKELEQALEEELEKLEQENTKLAALAQAKDARISEMAAQIVDLNTEINALTEELGENRRNHAEIMDSLKQQLVAVEILNEDMESQDRVLEQKLRIAQVLNNELLERIALVENDLELERDANVQLRLRVENLENVKNSKDELSTTLNGGRTEKEVHVNDKNYRVANGRSKRASINEKRASMARDTTFDTTFADGTVLDISEMLASEPPANISEMPRLSSLHMIQELYTRSDALRTKVGDLKASTTTDTHTTPITARKTLGVKSQSRRTSEHERVVTREKSRRDDSKKSRLREVMRSMFS